METIMTVEQLRKRASELKIKNIKKYKKTELITLINEAERVLAEKEVREAKKSKSSSKKTMDRPRGKQSLQIYEMLIEHPTWSHYKIRTIMGCTYTNVRRVWQLYVEGKFEDKRVFKNKNK